MELKDIIRQIDNVSKLEIKLAAPADSEEIKDLISRSKPEGLYEKMVLGYLTSICAEYMHPETLQISRNDLDYIGFELEKGHIEVGTAGNRLGTCMKSGKITAKIAGEEAGSSMTGGEIIADEIKSIGNTIGGRISVKSAGKISKNQGAEIYINGVRFKRSLLGRLFG